jgi:hypothetical protein
MNLKWKPTQISLELPRRLFGPDRAEVTKWSNHVGPDVDNATHKYGDRSTNYIVLTKDSRHPARVQRALQKGSVTGRSMSRSKWNNFSMIASEISGVFPPTMSALIAFLPNQLGGQQDQCQPTSSRKTEKFRMNPFVKLLFCMTSFLAAMVVLPPAIFAAVDSTTVYARAFALLAAEPYVKQGFHVREDYWTGELSSGEKKAIRQQLFKGNEYWFWLGTEVDRAKASVHIYDSDGKLAEQPDSWAKEHLAAGHIIPKTTGSYFIIVSVEESPVARTHWALVYGFR